MIRCFREYDEYIVIPSESTTYLATAVYVTEYAAKTKKPVTIKCNDTESMINTLQKVSSCIDPLIEIVYTKNRWFQVVIEQLTIPIFCSYGCDSQAAAMDEITPFWFKCYEISLNIESSLELARKELGTGRTLIMSPKCYLPLIKESSYYTIYNSGEQLEKFDCYLIIGEDNHFLRKCSYFCMTQPKIKKIAILSYQPNVVIPRKIEKQVSRYHSGLSDISYNELYVSKYEKKLKFFDHWMLIDPSQRAKDVPIFASLPSMKYEIHNKRKLQATLYAHKQGINNPKKYYTTSQLKQMLSNKGLSTNGKRQKLIERLLK